MSSGIVKANPTFESFMTEFKHSRENIINILKIVIDQNKVKNNLKIRLKNSKKCSSVRKLKTRP